MRRLFSALALVALTGCAGRPSPERSAEATRAFTEAGLAQQSGQLERAATLYDQATALDPTAVESWLAAADARARLGQWPAAAQRAERARTLAPADPRTTDAVAKAKVAAGDVRGAHAEWHAFTQAHPEVAEGWRARGNLSALLNELDEAEQALSKAATLTPDDAAAWERLGAVRQRMGRSAAAAQSFDRAVRLDAGRKALEPRIMALALDGGDHALARASADRMAGPEAPPGAGALAVAALLIKREDYFGAANELEGLIERQPDNVHGKLLLAQVFARVDRVEPARALVDQLVGPGPVQADALRLQGLMRLRSGDGPGAIESLKRATLAQPDQPAFQRDYARVLQADGKLREALGVLSDAVARWPRDADLRYAEAIVMHDLGDHEGALARMQAALRVGPRHAGILNYVGFTLAERGVRLREAEGMIRLALEREPNNPAIADSLGWVLYRQGRFDEALTVLSTVVKAAEDEVEVRFHLAVVLHAAGRTDEAKQVLADTLARTADAKARRLWRARWRRETEHRK